MSKENGLDLKGLVEQANAEPLKVPVIALDPTVQAYMNSSISAAVKEIFASMGPVFEKISLTPEKLALAEKIRRAPTEEQEAAKARERRELKNMQADEAENRKNRERIQAACPHKYKTGLSSIGTIHNFPDRQARGMCMQCSIQIHPREWVILAPSAEHPRGVPMVRDAHPLYHLVLEAEAGKS